MAREEDAGRFLSGYSRYFLECKPADFLSGDADKRDVEITLSGKREDDLNGVVKRRFLSDLNRWFWEHPKDVDDTRLVFEAEEKGAEYAEGTDGNAKLVLRISVGLAQHAPDSCGCC